MSASEATDLAVAVTIDTDSDAYFGDPNARQTDKTILGWNGLEIGKHLVAGAVARASDELGVEVPLTWFVRCDRQIDVQFGSAGFLLETYADWWRSRIDTGDEIQWHAHLYRRIEDRWVQETDPGLLREDLELGRSAIQAAGHRPSVIRVGEAYGTNQLMDVIESLGVRADSSCLPKRHRVDDEKTIDWKTSPNRPYHPSVDDYRREEPRPRRRIWEIPLNTIPTRVSYDREPIPRYVNPAFHPGVIDAGLADFITDNSILVTISHPFELVREHLRGAEEHPLLSFDPEAMVKNLRAIVRAAEAAGKTPRFVTMNRLLELLEGKS